MSSAATTTGHGPGDCVGVNDLIQAAEVIENQLVLGKLKTREQLEAQKPGGPVNPEFTALAWLDYLRWLDRVQISGGREEKPKPIASTARSAAVEAALTAALAEAPEAVECSDGVTRFVYPKSVWALQWLDLLNQHAATTTELIVTARDRAVPEDIAVLQLAPLMQAIPLLLWAWIVTHKGPTLPFDDDAPLTDPPEWTKSLSPDDLFKLLAAHRRVNGTRLRLVTTFVEPSSAGSGGPAFSVAGFVGAIAGEMEPDAGRRLMRSVSLGQIFATRVTAAAAAREAMRRAKDQRES